MAKKTTKASKSKKSQKYDARHILCHPSTWLAAILALALLVVYGVSMYGFTHIEPKTTLDSAKLTLFDHLAESYVREMESVVDGKTAFQEMTGYGISDEDGVFYVTFDVTACEYDEEHNQTCEDPRHAIMYFWEDAERGTYSHAFSYHDDASYHPGGIYYRLVK